jgi:hypothetical protein
MEGVVHPIRRALVRILIATLMVAGLAIWPPGASTTRAAGAPAWSVYTDTVCHIQFKYPPAFQLNPSGAKDFCSLFALLGLKGGKRPDWSLSLSISDMSSAHRQALLESGSQVSPSSFALYLAALQCQADGHDGSTYCVDGTIRSTFKTAEGLQGYEIYLTEVHEFSEEKKVEKQPRGPIFALDMSNDETVWLLLAEGPQDRLETLRAILNTVRVWGKPRRAAPRVVEIGRRFSPTGQAFTIRVTPKQRTETQVGPPRPPTGLFVLDPRGRRLGVEPATNTLHSEIPAITYSGWAESGVGLREPVEGRYVIEVAATASSIAYEVAVQAPDQTGRLWTAARTGRTSEPGAVDRYELVYSKTSAPAVTLADVPDVSDLTVILSGAGDVASDLLLTDPQGRSTGRDPVASAEHRKIPRSSYLDEGRGGRAMVLHLRQPADGSYVLQVSGTTAERYSLDIRARDRGGAAAARPEFRGVPTARDTVHLYRLEYRAAPKASYRVAGGFDGGGNKPPEVNELLTYANLAGPHTVVRPGAAKFPLLIFFGAAIRPDSFNAMLNGGNISSRFTPTPGQFELVWIPLEPGSNTLVLSVEGTTASGQRIKDTDELVFLVW